MLAWLTLVFTCQLAGEAAVRALGVPVPGPVAGMVLLFIFLCIRGEVPEKLATVADTLLRHLSLLFVPAGVGVMAHVGLLGENLVPVSLALVLSTLVAIAVTALAMRWLNRGAGQ